MASKSCTDRLCNSTRIGKRPCNSGIRSLGLLRWKAPDATNRIWSVLTMPYLVLTVVPSTNGSKSRCTPWRETSAPLRPSDPATLSISSMKTIPFCSALAMAWLRISSSLTSLAASSSVSRRKASATLRRRVERLSCCMLLNMERSCSAISSMPAGPMICMEGAASGSSTSISLSSNWPSRSFLRNAWRVAPPVVACACTSVTCEPSVPRAEGSRMSRMRSSAISCARCCWVRTAASRVCLMATSTRSRMMESTSLPT